ITSGQVTSRRMNRRSFDAETSRQSRCHSFLSALVENAEETEEAVPRDPIERRQSHILRDRHCRNNSVLPPVFREQGYARANRVARVPERHFAAAQQYVASIPRFEPE